MATSKATLGYEEGKHLASAAPTGAALKATMGYGSEGGAALIGPSLTSTLLRGDSGIRAKAQSQLALDATVGAASLAETAMAPSVAPGSVSLGASLGATRNTVLPRRKRSGEAEAAPEWQVDSKPRFEQVELLGRGGMGEVALAKDNDIRRTVAVKRLLPEHQNGEAVLRFADEVRAIGQLEHPGIVPVYDVGIDEGGQHYLVMKHVQGETLESVIEKLQAGDPAYLERFSHETRAHIFVEILQAIRYAHDRGIIHRDIKPANIMIGPFGEVTVMDWGLAKTVDRDRAKAPAKALETALPIKSSTADGRLLETVHGALLGTPLYMSPEQAAGRNDDLDERSDIFSLCVVFYEMLTLEHPLRDLTSVQEVLASLIAKDIDLAVLRAGMMKSGAPVEYFQFLFNGLARDRDKRFSSVEEMEKRLQNILSGKIPVLCHVSLAKNVGHKVLRWIDHHQIAYTLMLMGFVLGVVGGVVWGGVTLVKALLA